MHNYIPKSEKKIPERGKITLVAAKIKRQEYLTSRARIIQNYNNVLLKELILKKVIRSGVKDFSKKQLRNTVKEILRNFNSLNSFLLECDESFIMDLEVYIKNNLNRIEQSQKNTSVNKKREIIGKFKTAVMEQEFLIMDYKEFLVKIKSEKLNHKMLKDEKSNLRKELDTLQKEIEELLRRRKSKKLAKLQGGTEPISLRKKIGEGKSSIFAPLTKLRKRVKSDFFVARRRQGPVKGIDSDIIRSSFLNPIHTRIAHKQMLYQSIENTNKKIERSQATIHQFRAEKERCKILIESNFTLLFSQPSILHEIKVKLTDLIILRLQVDKIENQEFEKNEIFRKKEDVLRKMRKEKHDTILDRIGEDFTMAEKEYLISVAKINVMWNETIKNDKRQFKRQTTLMRVIGKPKESSGSKMNKNKIFRTKSLKVNVLIF